MQALVAIVASQCLSTVVEEALRGTGDSLKIVDHVFANLNCTDPVEI